MSTNRGLTRLAVQDSAVMANNFLQENGLQSNIFNKDAGFKDEEGYLYFGGNSGLNYFDPTEIHPDNYVPPIVITDLRVMNQAVRSATRYESPLVLNHLRNNFSVTFSALSFSQPENNKYAVILEGLETEWRILNADTRTLDYSNLSPGRYVLKVKAANSSGYWSAETEKVFIKVKPAPYKTWWAFVLYGLLLGGILLLFLRMEKKNQEVKHALEIEHLEREKSDKLNLFKQGLFANVSHEFLTPLSILSCLMDDWKHLRTAPNGKDLSLAQRNINRLTRLNRQFLYYSKSEVKELPLNVTKGRLDEFVKRIGGNFVPLAKRNQIQFDIRVDFPDSEVWFDPEKLDVVLFNLLSNAFKYTPEEGEVILQLTIDRNNGRSEAVIEVIDSGTGIEAAEQSAIFNRYHALKGNDQLGGGFGIGLSLCKAMVEAHKGEISLQSEIGKGTQVTFILPVNRSSYDDSEVYNSLRAEKTSTNFLPEKIEEDTILRIKNLNQSFENKPTILLVDDHADFRNLLRTNLVDLFTVLETNNGVTAYEMALNKKVDLILSDIVMPAMNGVELCTKIKSNPSTVHLPVILLTAKSSDFDKAEGYRAGADSFMSKPFNLNTLLTRVEALLQHRKRMEARMKMQKRFYAEVSTNDKDDLVLSRVRGFIEENLANPDLSVKLISSELSISNSMLYRKTSEILNINPNMLIRKIRMIKAVELLEENQLTVSEIAYKCGYRDVSYFGVSFKKEYGTSPSHFQRNKKV
nr:hybrid sensor histidine kinase/response regulator transcription factor [Geofilum rubicundum]